MGQKPKQKSRNPPPNPHIFKIPSTHREEQKKNKSQLTPSAQNSRINCLHIPHGLAGGSISLATATARTTGIDGRGKLATSDASAQRSAHVPTGVDAISTFEPVKSVVWLLELEADGEGGAMRMEEPTRKLL
jgi:hypothetical protein